jgi:hypothetical protein
MNSAAWFVVFFVVFSVVRLGLATLFFHAVLPDDDRCPNCDAPTIRVRSRGWNLLMPWFRTSYCMECQWEGMLRHSKRPLPPAPPTRSAVTASRRMPTAPR